MPHLSLRKRLTFYGLLIVLVTILPLAALETYLRLPRKSRFVFDTSGLLAPSNAPGLGYRLARNYSNGHIQTDERGFLRGGRPNAPAASSILLLGDSVSFAAGVRYEETFASLLEKELSRKLGQQIAVDNTGTPGYNTVQEAALLRDLRKSVKPSVIVLQFCMNDYQESVTLTSNSSLDATSTGGGRLSLFALLYRSRALYFLKDRIKDVEKLYPERFPMALHYTHYIHKAPGWQRAKGAIRDIADTAREMNARFLLVIFPVEQQLRIGDRGPQEDLLAFSKQEGIQALDLYPCLVNHWREHLFFDYSVEQHVVDKVHLSKRGHELAAREIAAAILNGAAMGTQAAAAGTGAGSSGPRIAKPEPLVP